MTDQLPSSDSTANTIELAADIVSAYVSNNSVPSTELPSLINAVHDALRSIGQPAVKLETPKPQPAVPVKKSITADHLVSLEDGRRYKSLKRHLAKRGLTPEQYREKWGLPKDYPMVAPNYAAIRSELAKKAGLGQQRRKSVQAKAAGGTSRTGGEAPRRGGRKKSA